MSDPTWWIVQTEMGKVIFHGADKERAERVATMHLREAEPLYPASVVTALQEERLALIKHAEVELQKLTDDYAAEVEKRATAEARANAAEQRLKDAVKVLDRCEHDGGFDREIGPIGCMLGDKCVCIGVYPILTGQRAFIKEAGK